MIATVTFDHSCPSKRTFYVGTSHHVTDADALQRVARGASITLPLTTWPTAPMDHSEAPFASAGTYLVVAAGDDVGPSAVASQLEAVEVVPLHAGIDEDVASATYATLTKTWWATAGDATLTHDSLNLTFERNVTADGIQVKAVGASRESEHRAYAGVAIAAAAAAAVSIAFRVARHKK